MPDWYRRDGTPGSFEELAPLLGDQKYKRVASTDVDPYWVSTVWLGLDHGWASGGRPVIFETMVFRQDGPMDELAMERYSTEEEARAGHARMVAKVQEQVEAERSAGATDGDEAVG